MFRYRTGPLEHSLLFLSAAALSDTQCGVLWTSVAAMPSAPPPPILGFDDPPFPKQSAPVWQPQEPPVLSAPPTGEMIQEAYPECFGQGTAPPVKAPPPASHPPQATNPPQAPNWGGSMQWKPPPPHLQQAPHLRGSMQPKPPPPAVPYQADWQPPAPPYPPRPAAQQQPQHQQQQAAPSLFADPVPQHQPQHREQQQAAPSPFAGTVPQQTAPSLPGDWAPQRGAQSGSARHQARPLQQGWQQCSSTGTPQPAAQLPPPPVQQAPPGFEVLWQVEGDQEGTWNDYSEEFSQRLEQAKTRGEPVITARPNGKKQYSYYLQSMIQVRDGVNSQRAMRRVFVPRGSMAVVQRRQEATKRHNDKNWAEYEQAWQRRRTGRK